MIIPKILAVRVRLRTMYLGRKLTCVVVVADVSSDPKPKEKLWLTSDEIMYVISWLIRFCLIRPFRLIAELCTSARLGYFREHKPPRERTS